MRQSNAAEPNSYDRVPYKSNPFTQSHPDRLATIATLFGLHPAPVERCRVLELMALAIRCERLNQEGEISDYAELARLAAWGT